MSHSTISTKGQIVIPQDLRDRYRLKPHSKAFWIDAGGVLLLAPRSKDPLYESRGLLRKSSFTQKALKEERRRAKKQ